MIPQGTLNLGSALNQNVGIKSPTVEDQDQLLQHKRMFVASAIVVAALYVFSKI